MYFLKSQEERSKLKVWHNRTKDNVIARLITTSIRHNRTCVLHMLSDSRNLQLGTACRSQVLLTLHNINFEYFLSAHLHFFTVKLTCFCCDYRTSVMEVGGVCFSKASHIEPTTQKLFTVNFGVCRLCLPLCPLH